MGSTPAYLALKGDDGKWVETGYTSLSDIEDDMVTALGGKLENDNGQIDDGTGTLVTAADHDEFLQKRHFAPLRAYKAKASRPYTGTGSNVGPAVSGRVDLADVFVERNTDKASPVLFEYCCSGRAFQTIYLAYYDTGAESGEELYRIELTGANVSGYEIIGDRWAGQRFTARPRMDAAKSVSQQSFIISGIRKEQVTFWYTTIKIKSHGMEKGWHGGTDSSYS
jgi:type VI protein secretion system component Hcp